VSKLLSIGELARQTGVNPTTLRSWEKRFGFPTPTRVASGQRRYGELDVAAVRDVTTARSAGMTLEAAIARIRDTSRVQVLSFFAGLRLGDDHRTQIISKQTMLALSHALEDECYLHGDGQILIGAFQQTRFYRASAGRWARLARSAGQTVVFADFQCSRVPPTRPAEIPIPRRSPLEAEWVIASLGHEHAALLVGRELPEPHLEQRDRQFQATWSAEPALVRHALSIAISICRTTSPDVASALATVLATPRPEQVNVTFLASLTNRMIGYLDSARR
jgi:MerR family transcriptional regulator, light-induced transcriptional regulator